MENIKDDIFNCVFKNIVNVHWQSTKVSVELAVWDKLLSLGVQVSFVFRQNISDNVFNSTKEQIAHEKNTETN